MASILKVDKLDPQSGTDLEIGTSGDTVSIPSGATLDISSATLTPPATMPASSGVNLTALNATNLGSGTVPTARLGTGTASSSTILYGDQTYKTEPSGYDVSSITGATDLAAHPEITDEINLSDGGTLKRLDLKYMISRPSWTGRFTPSFYASTGTESVLPMNSIHFDSDGCFNNTSSSTTLNGLTAPAYSFTPNVPGYYYCTAVAKIWYNYLLTSSSSYVYLDIRKNGSTRHAVIGFNVFRSNVINNVLIPMNGTGDYIQFTINPGTSFGSTQCFYSELYYNWYSIVKVAGLPTTAGG